MGNSVAQKARTRQAKSHVGARVQAVVWAARMATLSEPLFTDV